MKTTSLNLNFRTLLFFIPNSFLQKDKHPKPLAAPSRKNANEVPRYPVSDVDKIFDTTRNQIERMFAERTGS